VFAIVKHEWPILIFVLVAVSDDAAYKPSPPTDHYPTSHTIVEHTSVVGHESHFDLLPPMHRRRVWRIYMW